MSDTALVDVTDTVKTRWKPLCCNGFQRVDYKRQPQALP